MGTPRENPWPAIETDATARLSVLALANALLAHVRLLVGVALLGALTAAVVVLLQGRTYQAQSSFVPEASAAPSTRLAGLAAQLGLGAAMPSGGESIDFYASLIKSPLILEQVAVKRYQGRDTGRDTVTGTIIDIYHIGGRSYVDQLHTAVKLLQSHIDVRTDQRANLVSLVTTGPSRELAEQLNRNLLDAISDFNLRKRQSQGRAEREFVEGRLTQAQQDLEAAEAALETFMVRNRRYQDSPELMVEAGRLQRRVDLRQQVYVSLAQSREQARMEEVRNTPVFTVVDVPERSARPLKSRKTAVVMGFVVGALCALALILALGMIKADAAQNPAHFVIFRAYVRRALRAPRLSPIAARAEQVLTSLAPETPDTSDGAEAHDGPPLPAKDHTAGNTTR